LQPETISMAFGHLAPGSNRIKEVRTVDTALVLVDIQNDFLPTGALPVPKGDQVVPVANRLQAHLSDHVVVATLDWHPPDHQSFASQHPGHAPFDVVPLHGLDQVLWPDHCVQFSHGAGFARGLDQRRIERVFTKGLRRELDSYSGFFDNARRNATGLEAWLRQRGIGSLVVLGLATDVCVKATVLDAVSLGFETRVVADGCRGVDMKPGDSGRALEEMAVSGSRIVTAESLLESSI
jgi:nicotinamidase/pyrazinamidase